VTYVDTSQVRQGHAFVAGFDDKLYALSLNLDQWEWRSLPPPPSVNGGVSIVSSPAVTAYLFEDVAFTISAFVLSERPSGGGKELLAYNFNGVTKEEGWADFTNPPDPNLDTAGATVYNTTNSLELYALTPNHAQHQLFLQTWDGGMLPISSRQWSKLTDGEVPRQLSGDSALTTCIIPIKSLQRTVSFNSDQGGDLFACLSDDGAKWTWHDLGNDLSGRVADFGGLGAFSYIRVTDSKTLRSFTPILVAVIRYSDGSLAINAWDGGGSFGDGKPHWANLGSPPGGAVGRPCGAGFYVGSGGNALETVIVLTATADGQIFVNGPGAFGREWVSLGLPEQ
jgi:hypothetical protein